MKFLTNHESNHRLNEINKDSPTDTGEIRADLAACLDRSAATTRLLLTLIDPKQEIFLFIREWGIWRSLENEDLFHALRAASNNHDKLADVPGHLFAPSESARLASYVQVILLSGWGGVLIGLENRNRLAISHDSWVSIRSSIKQPDIVARLESFGLPHRTAPEPTHITRNPA